MTLDFEKELTEIRRKEQEEQKKWLANAVAKIADNHELIYFMMGLFVQYRFKMKPDWNGEPNDIVWSIVDNYINNIDGSFVEYLYADDGPMVRKMSELKRIFPELKDIVPQGNLCEDVDTDKEILKLANRLYGLNMHPDDDFDYSEYFFALKFDFNSFIPININEVKKLKTEKDILKKYGHDTSAIDEKLKTFGLTDEQLEVL